MKNLNLFFFSAIFISMSASVAYAQEVVYIEVWESSNKNYPSKMIVITPNDEIEVTPLDNYKYVLKEGELGNGLIVKKELTRWLEQGFEVKSSFLRSESVPVSSNYTIILTKN